MKVSAIAEDAVIHPDTTIENEVTIGRRVVLEGPGIVLRVGARLDAACVIGEGVTIAHGAHVRVGAVVLASVPPYAIVEGNPARIVGYRSSSKNVPHPRQVLRHINIDAVAHMPRPSHIGLDVGGSALYLMRRVNDARGSLTVGEVPAELPFTPARYFAVFDVPSQELRGEHAHKQCQQFLICMHGSCRVLLDDGNQRCEVTLDRPDMGIYMPAMIWGTQYRYSDDAVLLVFASHQYDTADYLRSYDDFLAELGRSQA